MSDDAARVSELLKRKGEMEHEVRALQGEIETLDGEIAAIQEAKKERREFHLTADETKELLDACKPTPVMYLSGGMSMFPTPQENANAAWRKLGERIGFKWEMVKPVPGKGPDWFTAEVL